MKSATKSSQNYECTHCDFICCKKSEWNRHILTRKHKNRTNVEHLEQNLAPFAPNQKYICNNCNKSYNARNSLWYHEQKCTPLALNAEKNAEDDTLTQFNEKELIMTLLQQNSQLQNQIIELCKEKSISNNNNNINSHNKTFNLNMFLNETCKNAMNINDFVDSLQLQISDLENVGEVGYIEGISSIIIKNLNALDITERPIHCTDKKRETMYIRDEDKWEKEDEKRNKLHKMVKNVAYKNINLISDFQELHPDWKKINSKYSDQINKIIIESMGGKGDNEYEKEEKIIKRVAKEVFVDK
jgi:hypothetical protein